MITFVGGVGENHDSVSSYTVPKPAGVQANDFLVAFVHQDNDSAENATVSGFTPGTAAQTGWAFYVRPFYKVATASEPSSYTFGGGTNSNNNGSILVFRGVDTANPFAVAMTAASSGSSAGQTAPTITVPAGITDAMLVCAWFNAGPYDANSNRTFKDSPAPAGMTYSLRNPNTWIYGASAYQQLTAAGATGTRTATVGTSATGSNTSPGGAGRSFSMALRATAAPPSGPEPGRALLAS